MHYLATAMSKEIFCCLMSFCLAHNPSFHSCIWDILGHSFGIFGICVSPASRIFRDDPNPPHLPGPGICLFVTNEAKTVLKHSSKGTGGAQPFPWSPVVAGGGCSLWRSCRFLPWKPRSQPSSAFPLAQPQGTFPCSPCSEHHICYREKQSGLLRFF